CRAPAPGSRRPSARFQSARRCPIPSRVMLSFLAQRIAAAPQPAAANEGEARVREWLGEFSSAMPGRELASLLAAHPNARALIEVIAEGSPYLWELARADPVRLASLLGGDPDNGFDELLNATARAVAAASDEEEAMRLLRRMKSQAALLIALADL